MYAVVQISRSDKTISPKGQNQYMTDVIGYACVLDRNSDVVKDLRSEDEGLRLEDKDLWSKDKNL